MFFFFFFPCLGRQWDDKPRAVYRKCKVKNDSGDIHSMWIQTAERTVMIGVQWALVDSGLAAILFKLTTPHLHSPPPGERTDQEVAPDTSLPTNHTTAPNTARPLARSPARPLIILQPATEDGQILAHVSKVMAEASKQGSSWY